MGGGGGGGGGQGEGGRGGRGASRDQCGKQRDKKGQISQYRRENDKLTTGRPQVGTRITVT